MTAKPTRAEVMAMSPDEIEQNFAPFHEACSRCGMYAWDVTSIESECRASEHPHYGQPCVTCGYCWQVSQSNRWREIAHDLAVAMRAESLAEVAKAVAAAVAAYESFEDAER